jgi:hypothetical protein
MADCVNRFECICFPWQLQIFEILLYIAVSHVMTQCSDGVMDLLHPSTLRMEAEDFTVALVTTTLLHDAITYSTALYIFHYF